MKRVQEMTYMIRRAIPVILCSLLCLSTLTFTGAVEQKTGDSSNVVIEGQEGEEALRPELTAAYPELADSPLWLVDENNRLAFYYDPVGADVYVRDKSTRKVWSNAVSASSYKGPFYNKMFLSQLFTVRIADAKSNVEQYALTDMQTNADVFSVVPTVSNGRLILQIQVLPSNVSFCLEFSLDEGGLTYSIPAEQIQQKAGYSLVSIQVMSAFGAALSDEDGYILYPDGSGAVMEFAEKDAANPFSYTYPLYGTDEQSLIEIETAESQDTYNMMLPVYGIKHSDGAIFAAITEGSEDASLCIAPGGFQVSQLYRAYFTMTYKLYAIQTIGEQQDVRITPHSILTTRTVKIFILSGQENTYSDMATVYRTWMTEQRILQQRPKQEMPLMLDFFMGTTEKGLFLDGYVTLTTYDQVQAILKDLKAEGVENIQVNLLSWAKGGYADTPTANTAASSLGGSKGLQNLMRYCSEEDIPLYLNMEFVIADKQSKNINLRQDTVHDYFGNIIRNESESSFILDPSSSIINYVQRALKKIDFAEGVSINFDHVGEVLMYNYSENKLISRQNVAQAYAKALAETKQARGMVSVTGGNAYVLPYVDRISDLPTGNSGYFHSSYAVPFYQMVVHGYVDYTADAGNLASDMSIQLLRWLETGTAPFFILTQNSPQLLKNTDYTKLYSSEYAVWREAILEVYRTMKQEFDTIWNQPILRHEVLSKQVRRVVYAGGMTIYLNYGTEPETVDGVNIPAKSYTVVKG